MFKYLVLTLMLLSTASFAATPSFNCKKASTATEKVICSDEDLAILDTQMAADYKEFTLVHLNNCKGDKKTITKLVKSFHKRNIDNRNACKADKECLNKAYTYMIGTYSSAETICK